MKKILSLLALMSFPAIAHAHVKWFVETDQILAQETVSFSLTDNRILVWIAILVLAVVVATALERYLTPPKKIVDWSKKNEAVIMRVFEAVVGAHMLLTVALGHIIAPTFVTVSTPMLIAAILTAGAGGLLLFGTLRLIASLLMVGFFILVGIENGWAVLEHLHILGLASFIAINTLSEKKGYAHLKVWSIPVLRISLGIALVLLGLQEKILHPQLALNFLESHEWNFMAMIGIDWFTDQLFVISAGMSEILFGLLFLLGVITRINTIALSLFFITTAIVLGPTEINGHLTLLAIAVLFIIMGSGDKLKLPVQKSS